MPDPKTPRTSLEQEVFDWTKRVLGDPESSRTPEFFEFALRMRGAFRDGDCSHLEAAMQAARDEHFKEAANVQA